MQCGRQELCNPRADKAITPSISLAKDAVVHWSRGAMPSERGSWHGLLVHHETLRGEPAGRMSRHTHERNASNAAPAFDPRDELKWSAVPTPFAWNRQRDVSPILICKGVFPTGAHTRRLILAPFAPTHANTHTAPTHASGVHVFCRQPHEISATL